MYVFGGINTSHLQKVYSYDIAKDKWEKLMTRVNINGHNWWCNLIVYCSC
ncbi:hypothetical protein NYV49_17855 [Escherichia coli]|nr:hypothetical protein [Escherichia coli]